MGKFCVQLDIGFNVGIDVAAVNPEEALAAVRDMLKGSKGGDALYDLAGNGELLDWDVQVRGVFDEKSMLNNG